jgi:hypothetical protein
MVECSLIRGSWIPGSLCDFPRARSVVIAGYCSIAVIVDGLFTAILLSCLRASPRLWMSSRSTSRVPGLGAFVSDFCLGQDISDEDTNALKDCHAPLIPGARSLAPGCPSLLPRLLEDKMQLPLAQHPPRSCNVHLERMLFWSASLI